MRRIAGVLDLSDVRRQLAPYYSTMGRPSLDPELMIRMLLIGYLYGIRSERRLVEEVHLNLAYRWFCGLGLKGEVPERSSFSKTRHDRFRDSDAFRLVFENVLQTCLRSGLVGGDTFATDASVLEADARVMRRTEGKEPPEDWDDPGNVTRPVREYLDQLDKAAGLGGETPQPPKALSLTDPSAALTSKGKSKITFAYGTNYLIDTKAAIILFVCPGGKELSFVCKRSNDILMYPARQVDCARCALKSQCTTGAVRNLSVNAYEDVRRHVVGLSTTEAFKQSARLRRKVEMLFAHLKRNLNFRRLRLRGMTGARDECVLAATR